MRINKFGLALAVAVSGCAAPASNNSPEPVATISSPAESTTTTRITVFPS
jgi:hypothetical protein